jgi:hypothetical protein
MWWWLVGSWLGGSILFVPSLCLLELTIESRKEKVDKPSPQQAEADHASQRPAGASLATAPQG